MPGVNGIELATEARRLRRDLYIVFASGRDRVAGAPFLRKPFNRQALSRIVAC
jgi:two-component SAPR family response regulator